MTSTATSTLVAVQTLRGNAGIAAATAVVEQAVASYNATNGTDHIVASFVALQPNTKGMQFALSLYASLARVYGATLVRLSVHNGACCLCGPASAVAAVQSAYTPAYNAAHTAAAASYTPASGNRMAYTNSFTCGVAGGIGTIAAPATLAYGIGMLHTFAAPAPAPYAAGVAASQPIAELVAPNPSADLAPAPRKPATRARRTA